MFFGSETRPAFLPSDIKVKKEVKQVCSRDKKCRGSMPIYKKCKCGEEVMFHVFHYWDGTEDFGIESYKCTAEYNGHTYCWYEDRV